MKCSRIALLLVPMVLGLAAAASATDEYATGPLEKTAWLPLSHLDAMYPTDSFESATDGRDGDLATDDRDDDLEDVAGKKATDSEVPALRDSNYNGYYGYGNDADQAESSSDSDQDATAASDMSTTAEPSDDDADQSSAVERSSADADPEPDAFMESDDAADTDQSNTAQQATDMNGYDGESESSEGDVDTDNADPMNSDIEDSEDAGGSDGGKKAESLEIAPQTDGDAESSDDSLSEYAYCCPQNKCADNADSTAVCRAALLWLADRTPWTAEEFHAAFDNVCQQLAQVDWDTFLGGQSSD
jgi:hypothetical protein